MTSQAHEPERKRRKTAVPILLVCGIVLVLAGLLFDVIAGSQLAAVLREARSRGGAVTLGEIGEALPTLPDEANAARVLLDLQGRPEPQEELVKRVPFMGEVPSPPLGQRWSAEVQRDVDAYLLAVAPELQQIDKLEGYESGVMPFVLPPNPHDLVALELPRLGSVRHCVKLKSLQVVDRAIKGDNSRLAGDVAVLLKPGRILSHSPLLISYFTGIACDALTVSVLEQTLGLAEVLPDQLGPLQQLLARTESDNRLAKAMRGERGFMIAASEWARTSGGFSGRLPAVRGLLMRDEANGIRLYNRLVEAAEDASTAPQVQSVGAAAGAGRSSATAQAIPSLLKAFELENRRIADLRCARAALAAERHRQASGNWPARLEDLVPSTLESVPADPFAPSASLRMTRKADRLIIYSVGPNGTDERGDLRRGDTTAIGTDIGFILIDPASRGRAAPQTQTAPASEPAG